MASTATIILTGITYLMLTPDATTPTSLGVAVTRVHKAIKNKQGNAIPRHVPFILVEKDDLAAGSERKADYVVKVGASELHLFILKNEQLTFEGITTPNLSVRTTATTTRLPFNDHVPRVQSFCPTCALLTATDIDAPDFKKPIAATFRLTAGVLGVKKDAVNCDWDFDQEGANPDPSEMKLAQEVTVDVSVDPQLKIKSSLTTINKKMDITFKAAEPIEVTVGSAPLEDILLVAPADHDHTDQHFGLYYELLEPGQKKPHPLPRNVGNCEAEEMHRLGGANCPPVTQWP